MSIGGGDLKRQTVSEAPPDGHSPYDWLHVTLDNIADGVITTDPEGRVTYLNCVAQNLTGWSKSEASGVHVTTLFRVVDDRVRNPIELSILRALRESVSVHLTNHALLIARDGSERPIEESASPVRSESGEVLGAVLIFRDISDLKREQGTRIASEAFSRDLSDRSDRQKRLYESILNNTPDLAYVWGLDHRFIYANEGLLRMWGRTWEEAIGKNCLELGYEPWHAAMHDREIEQVVATRKPVRGEVPFVGTFGRRVYDYILVPVLNARGEVEAVAGTTRDVTERKNHEMLLRRATELSDTLNRINTLLHSSFNVGDVTQRLLSEGAVALQADSAVMMTRAGDVWAVTHLHGVSATDYGTRLTDDQERHSALALTTRVPVAINDSAADPRANPAHLARLNIRSAIAAPLIAHGNGLGVIVFNFHGEPRTFADTEIAFARQLAAISSIAIENARLSMQRERADASLRASEQRLRLASEAAELGIWVWDIVNDRVSWENDRPYQIFGVPRDSRPINSQTFKSEFLAPEHAADFERAVGEAVAGRERFHFIGKVRRGDGAIRWLELTGRPMHADDGSLLHIHGTVADITDLKLAEEEARLRAELDAKFRTMFDQGTQFAGMLSLDGTVVEVNRLALDACGFTREEVVGRPFWQCGWWNRSPELMAIVREACLGAAAGRRFRAESVFFTADGSERFVDLTIAPVLGNDGRVLFVSPTGADITERKWAEAGLRESEERFRTLADNMSQFAWTADARGARYWFNKRWYEYTGTTPSQMVGWGWTNVYRPDRLEPVLAGYRRALETGQPWEDMVPIRSASGEYRWFLSRAVPITDDQGVVTRWLGTNTDITAQVDAEKALVQHKAELEQRVQERSRELMEAHLQLRRTERMASMGTLSAGLGHDMSNLLLPLMLRLDALQETPLTPEAQEDIRAIRTAAHYLQKLATGLRLLTLDVEGPRPGDVTNVGPWWEDASGVMRNVLPRGVSLEAEITSVLPAAISKPALTQVIFNLVQNAGDAMKERTPGKVRIRSWDEPLHVCISVEDSGVGMSEEVMARCMEPFFTTKARGMSTGLGLSLVYGRIQEVGGTVDLRSKDGVGTTFSLRIPRAN